MKIDLDQIKKNDLKEIIVLVTTYTPKWDDGYDSWGRKNNEDIIGKTLDDPELETNLNKKIQERLAQSDVRSGFQKPTFHLEERKIRYAHLKIE